LFFLPIPLVRSFYLR